MSEMLSESGLAVMLALALMSSVTGWTAVLCLVVRARRNVRRPELGRSLANLAAREKGRGILSPIFKA